MDKLIIGTRGSQLALAQAGEIRHKLAALFPKIDFRLKEVRTEGDKRNILITRHAPFVGFFTKELEEALLSRAIDIAVHSLKDLPTKSPEELQIAAITRRESPQDGLVTEEGRSLSELRPGSRIGTGSARRKSQLLHVNGSFHVVGIRGNIDTRLRRLKKKDFDALVLALAGLRRYGVDAEKIWPIPYEVMLPAPGQGTLALQVRRHEKDVEEIVSRLDDPITRRCVTAERSFLSRLGGGCQLPLGALGKPEGEGIFLEAVLMSEDGKRRIRSGIQSEDAPCLVGEKLGEKFLEMGAEEILNEKG